MRYLFICIVFVFCSTSIYGQGDNKSETQFTESIKRGAFIYKDFCVTCHLPNGKGVEKTFPPLANSDYLLNNRTASVKAIKFGQKGEIIVNGIKYNSTMEPLGLTDEEIADVMNYITNSWGNKNDKIITVSEVSKIEQ